MTETHAAFEQTPKLCVSDGAQDVHRCDFQIQKNCCALCLADCFACCRQKKDRKDWPCIQKGQKKGPANTKAIMHVVLKEGHYFGCNLFVPSDMSSLPDNVRKAIEFRELGLQHEAWKYHDFIQDLCRATLWLLGVKDCGTSFHVNWAEASNIAWAVDDKVRIDSLCAIFSSTHAPAVCKLHKHWQANCF